jgi:hypothetical protein
MIELTASTQETHSDITMEEVIKESKRIEEDCIRSSKGHFVAANFWSNFHLIVGIPSVVLACIAGTSSFINLPIYAGVISIIVAVLTSIATFLNPKERAGSHFTAGNNYTSLQSTIRRFWSIECKNNEPIKLLIHKLEEYSFTRDRLNRESTQIPRWAYNKGKKYIEDGEAEYAVDKRPLT